MLPAGSACAPTKSGIRSAVRAHDFVDIPRRIGLRCTLQRVQYEIVGAVAPHGVGASGINLAAPGPCNMTNGWSTPRLRTVGPNITYDRTGAQVLTR